MYTVLKLICGNAVVSDCQQNCSALAQLHIETATSDCIFILFLDLRAGIQKWRRNHYHSALIEQKPAEPWSSNKLSFPSVWACDRYSGFTISLRAQRSSSSHLTLFLYSSEFFGPPSSGDKRDIFLHSFCFCKVQIVWEH